MKKYISGLFMAAALAASIAYYLDQESSSKAEPVLCHLHLPHLGPCLIGE